MFKLSVLDGAIIVGFLISVVAVGAAFARQASRSASEFFLSGRTMPWWLLGISMVACTFSCGTPNLITDIVRNDGIAGNWVWWAFLLTGMLTVFVYAKLWRRSALDTDLGFYELRYSGRPAAVLRGFRALYLGVFFNVISLGIGSLAAIKIGQVIFGLSAVETLVWAGVGVGIYATLGGLTGSIWADFYQYTFAMVGAIAAAVYLINADVGGVGVTSLAALVERIPADKLSFFPSVEGGDLSLLVTVLVLPLAVQWWNVWYPGAEPGAAAILRSECWRRRTRSTRSARRCSSTSCTMRSARGHGFWWRWSRWWRCRKRRLRSSGKRKRGWLGMPRWSRCTASRATR